MSYATTRRLLILTTAGCLTMFASSAWAGGYGWWKWVIDPDFGPAVNVTGINDPMAADGCPIESPDGLSLVIASRRDGGDNDIWASDRASVDEPYGPPLQLPAPINSADDDFCPTPVSDRSLYFVSTRPGGCSTGGNMYVSRQGIGGEWSEPELLECAPEGPNFDGAVFSPSVIETWRGTFLFYSADGKRSEQDIYVSKLGKDGKFGPGHLVRALSQAGVDDRMPNVRHMGRGLYEVVFSSTRAGGSQDVHRAVSYRLPFHWSKPVKLGPNVNTEDESETRATLSEDGKRLYFGRSGEIYVSER